MAEKNQNFASTLGLIDESVVIAEDVKIYPNVYLLGNTVIGKGTIIYPNTIYIYFKMEKMILISN